MSVAFPRDVKRHDLPIQRGGCENTRGPVRPLLMARSLLQLPQRLLLPAHAALPAWHGSVRPPSRGSHEATSIVRRATSKATPIPQARKPADTPVTVNTTPDKLLLIDGTNIAFRSYWVYKRGPTGGLATRDGTPTSICFGFMRTLLSVLEVEKPTAMAVVFDGPDSRKLR